MYFQSGQTWPSVVAGQVPSSTKGITSERAGGRGRLHFKHPNSTTTAMVGATAAATAAPPDGEMDDVQEVL